MQRGENLDEIIRGMQRGSHYFYDWIVLVSAVG